jgi:hypothetical protein
MLLDLESVEFSMIDEFSTNGFKISAILSIGFSKPSDLLYEETDSIIIVPPMVSTRYEIKRIEKNLALLVTNKVPRNITINETNAVLIPVLSNTKMSKKKII